MITRFAPFALIALFCTSVAAQEVPGDYILLLDEQNRPLAGSYRIGPDVKMTIRGTDGGLPRNPVYLDRAFFPTREAEMLAFYNARHAYSSDPAAIDVGGEMRIVDKETLQPPLFKDQKPEHEKALIVKISARLAFEVSGYKLVGKAYTVEGPELGDEDRRLGDFFHVETFDIVLPAPAARKIAAVETGKALSSSDFEALFVERTSPIPDFTTCVSEKRKTPDYKALAEKQKASVDAFLANNFSAGQVFWSDAARYEANFAMSVYSLCPN
ncbi:MAG: hypothetical protein ACT6U0_08995 [Shinella sp.]|uniref:hypothetical protein n=1 Tax=Shinella sp. TaxID=1870904 RepID=UPI0040351302